jgi:hypothetical protein
MYTSEKNILTIKARSMLIGLALVGLLLCGISSQGGQDPYIVGAIYYPWYGGSDNPHWPAGVAHQPWAGYYYSGSPNLVRQQIDLATRYGIDVFAVSWTGLNSAGQKKFNSGFLKASNLDRIRFCAYYESQIRLGEKSAIYFDFNNPEVRSRFVEDMVDIARAYFHHPSYFKIGGRPVVLIYLGRALKGEFASAFQEAKNRLKQMGWNPYFVGDNLFYGLNDLFLYSQFDAITAYNLVSFALFEEGIDSTGKLASSLRPYFWQVLYQLRDLQVAGKNVNVDFQPGVLPQYDARVSRGNKVALLAQSKDEVIEMFRVAKEILDGKRSGPKIVWITSWNEWHEGTAIEPTVSGGRKYPGGNYEYDFLEAVSEVFH